MRFLLLFVGVTLWGNTLDTAILSTDALVVSMAVTGNVSPQTRAILTPVISHLVSVAQLVSMELSSKDSQELKLQRIKLWLEPTLARLADMPRTTKSITEPTLRDWQQYLNAPLVTGNLKKTKVLIDNLQIHSTNMTSMHYR